jgi:hypothetical protein
MIPDYEDAMFLKSLKSLFLLDWTKILPLNFGDFTASNEFSRKLKLSFGLCSFYYDIDCTRLFMLLFLCILEFCIFEFMC